MTEAERIATKVSRDLQEAIGRINSLEEKNIGRCSGSCAFQTWADDAEDRKKYRSMVSQSSRANHIGTAGVITLIVLEVAGRFIW